MMNLPLFIYQIIFLNIINSFFLKRGRFFFFLAVFWVALLVVELICFQRYSNRLNTNIIYNWWFPVEFVFYVFFLIKGNPRNSLYKKMWLASGIFLLFVLLFYVFFQPTRLFSTVAYQTGELLLLFFLFLRIHQLLSEDIIENPFRNPDVWLIMGLLISNLGSIMHLSVTNYLAIKNVSLLAALHKLNIIVTNILYACIMIYYYLEWKKMKSNT